MNKVVLDACVFAKLFLQEPDHQQALELITELTDRNVQVLVPSLFLYEVLSIAIVSRFPSQSAYDLISQYQRANLNIVEPGTQIILKAIAICEHGHINSGFPSFYDATYHALAIINKCHFITADKRHVAKARNFGHVTLLRDWQDIFN
jgi:predicted nucleic acid-binding protein